MKGGTTGDRWVLLSLLLMASLSANGCGSSALDGGGRGTGIGAVTVQGNIADSGPDAASEPECPALRHPATVSVRGTDIETNVEADCTFELADVPAGDVTLDFDSGDAITSLTVNGVPPETVVVLTDVRLGDDTTDVAAVDVRPAQPAPPRRFSIIAEPPTGDAPLVVQFSFAPVPLNTTQVRWNFGDGSQEATDFTPEHVYESPGDFVVTLEVAEPGREPQSVYLVVRATTPPAEIPLSVRLAARPQSGVPPLTVEFSATTFGSRPVVKYVWDFGDRSPTATTTTSSIAHTYERSGSFIAIVTAVDDLGRMAGNSFPVVVERNAVAVRPTRTVGVVETVRPATQTPTATPTDTPTTAPVDTATPSSTARPSATAARTIVAVTATRAPATVRPTALVEDTRLPTATSPRTDDTPAASVTVANSVRTAEPTRIATAVEEPPTPRPVASVTRAETMVPTVTARPPATAVRTSTRVLVATPVPTRPPPRR